jgi:2,4-dienoyl-CoA reductase-like NADH-dependent reductase (Old Yellow Enzyme family)
METLLKTNEIDFIGMARPLIREPNLPNRWLDIGRRKVSRFF